MMRVVSFRFLSAVLVTISVLVGLTGCNLFPTQGPNSLEVSVSGEPRSEGATGYLFVNLSPAIIKVHEKLGPRAQGMESLGGGRTRPLVLGVGDIVNVTIFEAAAGGLFIPAEAGVRAGNFVTLPTQEVDQKGTIQIPFAGQIPAAGKTLAEVKADIEARLKNRAIEPQAVVSLQESRSTLVTVTGEINQPTRFALARSDDRVIDALTRGGGSKWPPYETYITLQRGNRTATVYYNRLIQVPSTNIKLEPGDILTVSRLMRSFMALGASGQNGFINFEAETLTLTQAVGRAGGVLDSRGDPAQTFLYRLESRRVVEDMGYDLSEYHRDSIPVIYRVNLKDPQAYFLATRFPMNDKDVLFVSNAQSVEVSKVLQFIQLTANTVSDVETGRILVKGSR